MHAKKKFHKCVKEFFINSYICENQYLDVNQVQEYRTDEELLRKYCARGELVYLVEVYKSYMPLVYGVALKYLKRPEDAQDAVMQLFEELIVKVKGSDIKSFKAWLYTCVRNYCLMELRKRNRNLSVSLDDSFMEFCDDIHLTIAGEDEEREKALRECIEALPEKQRISVNHFFLQELSYKEVEERTGFSMKMVKSFIQNGKRNLKLCLERKGINSYEAE